jgi:ferric-dicitrate binding protein FerR (iron transport regulator)
MTRNKQAIGDTQPSSENTDFIAAAADWHTRLDGDDIPGPVRAEFDIWFATDVRHRDACRSINRLWAHLGEGLADTGILDLRRDAWSATQRRRRRLIGFRLPGGRDTIVSRRPMGFWAPADMPVMGGAILGGFEAGEQRVTALGTAFDVRLADKGSVQVALAEGRITVETIQSKIAAPIMPSSKVSVLDPGESLTAAGRESAAERKADVAKIAGWRMGRVVFDDDTLGNAVAEVNRYSNTAIVLADPALTGLRVSGVFLVGHSESFIETVTGHYPIQIAERSANRIVLAARVP